MDEDLWGLLNYDESFFWLTRLSDSLYALSGNRLINFIREGTYTPWVVFIDQEGKVLRE